MKLVDITDLSEPALCALLSAACGDRDAMADLAPADRLQVLAALTALGRTSPEDEVGDRARITLARAAEQRACNGGTADDYRLAARHCREAGFLERAAELDRLAKGLESWSRRY